MSKYGWQKRAWQFWLSKDTVDLLDMYAKEWELSRSAALTMIIKNVVSGKQIVSPTSSEKTGGEVVSV